MGKRLGKLVLLCVVGLALGAAGFALAGTTTLSLTYVGPQPQTATIPWGDTIRITNVDSVAHSLVSSQQEFQTGVIQPGQTFTTVLTGPAHSYSFRQTGGRGFPGKVDVAFSGTVSLSSNAAVNFGRSVRLHGTTSLHSTPVVLQVHRRGDKKWTTLTTVASSSSGAYAATIRLLRGGKLRATVAAGQIRSPIKQLGVRPTLKASRRGGRVIARLQPAAAALRLTLQCAIGHGHWKRVVSRRPNGAGIVSFAIRPGRGAVRVAATHRDARDGYAPQVSGTLSAAC
jgi:hypothetical protein